MAEDKEIRIGVDASAVGNYERQLRQSAKALADDMIANARATAQSSKDVLRQIEEEIKLIEKRNKLDKDFRLGAAQELKSSGRISQEAYRGEVASTMSGFKTDTLQTQLLRELIETVKQTSKQEIRELDINQQKYVDTGVIEMLDKEAAQKKRDYENDRVGPSSSENLPEENTGLTQRGAQRLANIPANVVGSRNMLDIASNTAESGSGLFRNIGGAGGIIGMIVAATVGKLISTVGQSAMTLETSLSERSRYNNMDVRSADIERNGKPGYVSSFSVRDLAKQGMTISERIALENEIRGASRTSNYGENVQNLINISKGTPLSTGDVSGLTALRRFGGGNVSPEVAMFRDFLKETKQDMSVLPEVIGQFTAATTTLVNQTGRADTGRMAQLMAGFGMQTGLKGDVMASTLGQIEQGLQRSSNPVIQAMQLEAARKAKPSASFFEIEKTLASPFSQGNEKYVSEMFQQLKRVSGGGERYERALSNVFGINPNLAGSVANWDLSKEVTPKMLSDIQKKSVSFTGEAMAATGAIKEGGKVLEGAREKFGFNAAEEISQAMITASEKIGNLINGIGGMVDAIKESGKLNEAAAKETNKKLDKAIEEAKAENQNLTKLVLQGTKADLNTRILAAKMGIQTY